MCGGVFREGVSAVCLSSCWVLGVVCSLKKRLRHTHGGDVGLLEELAEDVDLVGQHVLHQCDRSLIPRRLGEDQELLQLGSATVGVLHCVCLVSFVRENGCARKT